MYPAQPCVINNPQPSTNEPWSPVAHDTLPMVSQNSFFDDIYKVEDVVWAKAASFPFWPAAVCIIFFLCYRVGSKGMKEGRRKCASNNKLKHEKVEEKIF